MPLNPVGPAQPSAEEDPLPPRLREHLSATFEIEREIGRGGMATVWLARRRLDGMLVAIKVLQPSLARALGVQRFLREIRIAANTRSDHLVPLMDSGECDGLPYYVMPYVEGESLRQRLVRESQLPVAESVRIGRAIVHGLEALHRDGIVHRDIKPENVLLHAGAEVLVADYGIARALTASASEEVTSTGIVLGTPAYMSPEQAAGDLVDARSDQYAWGCIQYEMLAGVPPFHGASSQALIARHMHETPPSLRVVRPSVPAALESVIFRAMGKAPADRFENMEALGRALDRVDLTDLRPTGVVTRVRRRRRAFLAAAAVAGIVVAGYAYPWRAVPLDAGRVVVFPFNDLEPGHEREAEGVTLRVRSALEHIEPARWVDGLALLDSSERAGPRGLTAGRAEAITRQQHARYFIDGSIFREQDLLRIVVTLHDLEQRNDTSVQASGPLGASAAELGLSAVVGLLPRLTGLEKVIDVSSLRDRNAEAVTNWVRGEREYRQSRYRQALDYLHRAVAGDELLAPAALRGATAAMWLNREDTALALVATALRHPQSLAPRQVAFATALRLVLAGEADSAVSALRPLTEVDAQSADTWMLAGEAFLHLLPQVALNPQALRVVPPPATWPLEAWAEDAFKRALAQDPGFTPPLAHLAEVAARRGDVREFTRYADLLEQAGADSGTVAQMALIQSCMTRAPGQIDWKKEAQRSLRVLYRVGVRLHAAKTAGARDCARRAFAAILAADPAPNDEDWGSLMALFAMLAAEGAQGAALALVDSAIAGGMTPALGLYVVGAAAGVDPGRRADAFIAQLDAAIETRSAPSLWLLALWSARGADTTRLRRVSTALERRKGGATGTRLDTLFARVASAYLTLARRDSAAALPLFARLVPTGTIAELQRTLWEPLAPERLVYARLLLARGDAAGAHRVASVLDQPGIAIFPLFLRESLTLRTSAAQALRDERLAALAQARLRSLAEDTR